MKTIGGYNFPETREEAAAWHSTVCRKALASRVLVVARTRIEGKWAAYCDAVPGKNHDQEEAEVLHEGCKVPEPWARAIFPHWSEIPYAK